MKKLLTLTLGAALAVLSISHAADKESATEKALITGSGIDPANDSLLVVDASVTGNNPAIKRLKFTEVANVSGMFSNKENALGNPSTNGYVLSSTTGGTRSWVAQASGGTWGSITGTIGSQADLQLAFDGKQTRTWDGAVLPRTKRRLAVEAAAGAIRPFRLKHLVMGDSYNVSLSELMDTQIAPLREVGFGTTHTIVGAVTTDLAQWTRTPNAGTIYRLTGSGQSVQYGGATDFECYRIKVYYQAEDVTGTFAVETNTASAGWTEVPGATTASPINVDNNGTTGVGIFTYDFSTAEPRRLRAKWISGTVRILGFVLSDIREDVNSPRGGSAEYNFSAGGQNLSDWAQCPQAIWNTILRDLEPDFVSIKGDDSNWNGVCDATSSGLYGKMQIARDMDWIFVGRHPASASQYDGQAEGSNTNSGSELLVMDRQMRDFAIAQSQMWVNPRKIFPAYSVMEATSTIAGSVNTSAKLISGDNTHLTPAGGYMQAQAIIDIMARSVIDNAKIHKSATNSYAAVPRFTPNPFTAVLPTGASYGLGINGRTNSTAAGPNWREIFSVSKLGDNGEVGIHVGRYNEARIVTDSNGRWFINHGTAGFGNGLVTFPRYPSSAVEIHGGSRTTVPLLSLSGASGHTGDLLRIYQNAGITAGTEGTRTAGVTVDGVADFAGLRVVQGTPASATATGVANTICYDANYIYICTATNTWKRVAIATW